jgi:Flp pilus assembly pilin Flp
MPPGIPRFLLDHEAEEGQAMVEYALILALVTVAALTALTAMGGNVQGLLEAVAAHLDGIAGGL